MSCSVALSRNGRSFQLRSSVRKALSSIFGLADNQKPWPRRPNRLESGRDGSPSKNSRTLLAVSPKKDFRPQNHVDPDPNPIKPWIKKRRVSELNPEKYSEKMGSECWTRAVLAGLVALISLCGCEWQDGVRPKLFAKLGPRDYQSFAGDLNPQKSVASGGNLSFMSREYFSSVLYTNVVDDVLILGARNTMYKLDAQEFRLKQLMRWSPLEPEIENCFVKGATSKECQNYLKVVLQFKDDPDKYMVCGTNAYKPRCREYLDERGSYVIKSDSNGLGVAPFHYSYNSTAVLVGNTVFSGTTADSQGVDPIIIRAPDVRTVQYDLKQLNEPDFVGSFEHGDFVYFFFREDAMEHLNCGKTIYSRVARVCKNDEGHYQSSRRTWTTFFKSRLNCSVPGEYPFYFDEIQGISDVIKGHYGAGSSPTSINELREGQKPQKRDPRDMDEIVYATFGTPANSIGASAVCAFRIKDIHAAFAGKFKDMSSNWSPVPDHKVPVPRPGTCQQNSSTVNDLTQNFINSHTLMDDNVNPFFGSPIVVKTGVTSSRFTAIAVDSQVMTTEGLTFDVVFVGTTEGRVLKVINSKAPKSSDGVESVVIEELQVFDHGTAVKELRVMNGVRGGGQKSLGRLAVLSDHEVRSISVQRCDRATDCQSCVALQDPYCAWEVRSKRCESGDWTSKMSSGFIQSVVGGKHSFCPLVTGILAGRSSKDEGGRASDAFHTYQHLYGQKPPLLGEFVNILNDEEVSTSSPFDSREEEDPSSAPDVTIKEAPHSFTLETLVITVSAGAVAALVVGFVVGYCCGRRCQKDDIDVSGLPHMPAFQDADYEYFEQRGGLVRPMGGPHPGLGGPLMPTETAKLDNRQEEVTYAEPELVTGGLLGGSGPLNSRYVGTGLIPQAQQPGSGQPYTSSLLNSGPLGLGGPQGQGGGSKFNTIHSSVNKRHGLMGTPNHYESAADRVVGGAGLKDYTRIGEGGGPLLALRERDFLNQNHNFINSANSSNPSYHLSTLGRSSSMNKGPPISSSQLKNPDPTTMLLNTQMPQNGPITSAGGSSSSSGGAVSLLTSNEEGSLRIGSGKRPQVVDSAYGTTRSTKKVYL